MYTTRNNAIGFAQRTRKNLEYIERASVAGEDVHVVTQLANSLLGAIVFPWEQEFVNCMQKLKLDELKKDGWPWIEITMGECKTLYELVYHLRNAVAHGHLEFSSESRNPDAVTITVEDYKPKALSPYWGAQIKAQALREFCLRFMDLLEDSIG
jgi:hypothetical protein